MTEAQFVEGLQYAEDNFQNDDAPHLKVDKALLKNKYNLNGKKILDFGCGMGGMSLWYATTWPECSVYALDIDSHHIEVATTLQEKYQVHNVEFSRRNILETPLEDHERFDFIVLNDVAEHIQFPILKQIFKQLSNRLTDDGVIFVSYPPWRSPYASHVTHAVKVPWCQFLPESVLFKMIEKNNQVIVGDLESDLLEAYKGLNHLTHEKLTEVVATNNLKPVFRKSHCILNRLPGLKETNINFFPLDFLVTKEFLVLQRV